MIPRLCCAFASSKIHRRLAVVLLFKDPAVADASRCHVIGSYQYPCVARRPEDFAKLKMEET
jgi:hypothetical protein